MQNVQYTPEQLAAYAEHIVNSYKAMYDGNMPVHNNHFVVTFEPGSKYVRVVTENGPSRFSHSFLDAAGNIWKSAGWKAPAKNFTRGNITTPNFSRIHWTGAN